MYWIDSMTYESWKYLFLRLTQQGNKTVWLYLKLDIGAITELLALTGVLQGWGCQAFRTHTPLMPSECRCRMFYMAGMSYPSFLFISGLCVFISTDPWSFSFHVLDAVFSTFTSSSVIFCLLIPMFPPLPLMLVPSGGSCVSSSFNRVFLGFSPCRFVWAGYCVYHLTFLVFLGVFLRVHKQWPYGVDGFVERPCSVFIFSDSPLTCLMYNGRCSGLGSIGVWFDVLLGLCFEHPFFVTICA